MIFNPAMNTNTKHLCFALYTRHLKAFFNNVSTFKNLSCMALHAISVFDKV